ncbi:MAG: molybdopterin-guanine dinucleotide biosynthesis protein B [Candidatus Binatia bacterium]
MRPLRELLEYSSSLHGHLCSGQVLGVRMAMAGCREVGIEEPRGCKKLLVYVEMDRCATDAIQAVTGCSLGKRTLKFLDYGKMAASFINLETQRASRVLAKDDARSLVSSYYPAASSQREAETEAYAIMPEESLFCIRPIEIIVPQEDMPGVRSDRRFCTRCGEGINFRREIKMDGQLLCIPCAQGRYLPQNGRNDATSSSPKVLHVVGPKNNGKTTLIEKLIPELSLRGYRVGTIKHHHSQSPLQIDHEGKDSWRHRRAGAKAVALVSPSEVAVIQNTDEATHMDDAIKLLRGIDIVLVEGFRSEARTKIEVRNTHQEMTSNHQKDDHLLALITPEKHHGTIPCFTPDEIKPLVELIEKRILAQTRAD